MVRTQIKICGITRIEDAIAAVTSGADAVGLVFYSKSKRCVAPETAKQICFAVGPFVTTVGLFVNECKHHVESVLKEVPLHLLQFHGDEDRQYCESFNRPYMKAARVRSSNDVQELFKQHPNAVGFLLDAYVEGVPGGTGERFDWTLIPPELRSRCILAGGLNSENVADAIHKIHPLGVDVSGGVESSPGIKSSEKVQAFCRAVVSTSEGV